jgi:HAD superfamily hydrolase (TIGR01509 family)
VNFKAVIFDLDGLLVDSEPIWYKTWEAFRSKKGLKGSLPTIMTRGRGIKENVLLWKEKLGLKGDTKQLMAEYRSIFLDLAEGKLKLMDGANEILAKLRINHIPIALASSGNVREELLEILKSLNILEFFDLVFSGDDVEKGKPAPDIYLETARELNVKPEDCLVFEDSVNGAIAGKKAGMTVFGVNKDKKVQKLLKETGVDKVFTSLAEIKL